MSRAKFAVVHQEPLKYHTVMKIEADHFILKFLLFVAIFCERKRPCETLRSEELSQTFLRLIRKYPCTSSERQPTRRYNVPKFFTTQSL